MKANPVRYLKRRMLTVLTWAVVTAAFLTLTGAAALAGVVGTVLLPDGTPLAGGTIKALYGDDDVVEALVDPNGEFVLPVNVGENYRIIVEGAVNSQLHGDSVPVTDALYVPNGGLVGHALYLPEVTATGVLYKPDGTAVTDGGLRVVDPNGSVHVINVHPDGKYHWRGDIEESTISGIEIGNALYSVSTNLRGDANFQFLRAQVKQGSTALESGSVKFNTSGSDYDVTAEIGHDGWINALLKLGSYSVSTSGWDRTSPGSVTPDAGTELPDTFTVRNNPSSGSDGGTPGGGIVTPPASGGDTPVGPPTETPPEDRPGQQPQPQRPAEVQVIQTPSGQTIIVLKRVAEEATVNAVRAALGKDVGAELLVEATADDVRQVIAESRRTAPDQAPEVVLETTAEGRVHGGVLNSEAARELAAAGGRLRVQSPNGRLSLPAAVLNRAAGSNRDLIVALEAVDDEREDVSRQVKAPGFKSASPVVDFEIGLLDSGDGSFERLTSFEADLELSLPLRAVGDPDLLGGYWLTEDANGQINGREFVPGGSLANDILNIRVNHLSKFVALELDKQFSDVAADHWAARNIKVMAAQHVVTGVTETTFEPARPVTRAEFAALLLRALNLPEDRSTMVFFTDVSLDAWYAGALGGAIKAGLIKGYGDATLRPNAEISRQEMATIMSRALTEFRGKSALAGADVSAKLAAYADRSEVASWAQGAIALAIDAGLIQGRSATAVAPNGTTNRAEAATVIKRFWEQGR